MEFKADEFTKEQLEEGRLLFKKPCNFVLGVAGLEQLPLTDMPEIAFAGRSNVGKSSIINALLDQKKLARTSNTPGRTQQLNYFNLDDIFHIVDLPGYGYAQAPEKLVKQWTNLVFTFLQGRVNLKRVFLLIDSRHGIKKVDEETMELLDKAAVTYQIVLTKADKISDKQLAAVIQETEVKIKTHAAAFTKVIATSSEKGLGVPDLKAEINNLIKS